MFAARFFARFDFTADLFTFPVLRFADALGSSLGVITAPEAA
jgi:hypothetical protein